MMTPLKQSSRDTSAPILCSECPVKSLTIYGPTVCGNAATITNRRKKIHQYPARRAILRQGKASNSVYSLQSGWAFQYKLLKDGRRQILCFLIPGDIIPLEALLFQPYEPPFSVDSLTPVTLCEFESAELVSALSTTVKQKERFQKTAQRYFAQFPRALGDIGCRSAAGRIAQLILELRDRLGRDDPIRANSFEFPLRQGHIADATGLSTIHVNRTLVSFRERGLIKLDRQELTVLDYEELKGIAEDE